MTRTIALHIDEELAFEIVDRDLALMLIEAQAEALAEDLAANDDDRMAWMRAIASAHLERRRLQRSIARTTGGTTTAADVDRAVRLALVRRGLAGDLLDVPDAEPHHHPEAPAA
ncbi:hypothetical protein ER308_16205 [Egibacter rhizosphaerae]|uniref:Uncharacterized protein n=1 Tax=Egibacter rhizosphaerae TaxID=1670831 RepID=A0A411YIA7_9ACTN|nr:hypothetical protein [Egibacter rhizosphaerae]QBI20963.1 hypothetical protein ER308_16205 [Egibacter rhizosphaerae]